MSSSVLGSLDELATLPGVRLPHQRRSRERLEQVLDAAEGLIREGGIGAASMTAVAAAAGTSVGALYGRFDDKRSLVGAVHARFLNRTAALIEAAADPQRWGDRSLEEVIDGLVPAAVMAIRGNAGLIRAFLLYAFEDETMRERGEAATRRGSAAVIALFAARAEEIQQPDPELAADFAMRFVISTAQHSLIFDQPTPRRYSDAQLASELTNAVRTYLLGGPPPDRP